MAGDNGQNSFRRGIMSLVILGLLKQEDMYGYQLVQETEKQSGGAIVTQEGSLYPVLYKLLDQGLISDRKVLVGKRMQRVYYHLEPAGERQLKILTREYEVIFRGILRILKGNDVDAEDNFSQVVPMEHIQRTSGYSQAEEADNKENRKLSPELCF